MSLKKVLKEKCEKCLNPWNLNSLGCNPVFDLTLDCIVLSPAVIKQMQARPRQKHFKAFNNLYFYTRTSTEQHN